MSFCPKCGAQQDDGDSFCTKCGARLQAPDTIPTITPATDDVPTFTPPTDDVPTFTPPTDDAPIFTPPARHFDGPVCYHHPDEPAAAQCARCGKYICKDCADAYTVAAGEYANQCLCYDCCKAIVAENVELLKKQKSKITTTFVVTIIGMIIGAILFAETGSAFGTLWHAVDRFFLGVAKNFCLHMVERSCRSLAWRFCRRMYRWSNHCAYPNNHQDCAVY